MEISKFEIEGIKLEGLSAAGIGTCVRLPDFGICFDVAQGHAFAVPSEVFLITHGHMDHAGGIPYLISQRALNSLKPGKFVMPNELKAPMSQIIKLWSGIEGFEYAYELVGQNPGEIIEHKQNIKIESFKTVHRVASQGYIVKVSKKKLKPEFENVDSVKIVEQRRKGIVVEDMFWEPVFAFTGDTQIEFLDVSPQAAKSKILMMEVTYYDEKKSVATAREWGHIHLDELVPRLDIIESKKIVLIHTSRRYSRRQVLEILDVKVPAKHRDRVILF